MEIKLLLQLNKVFLTILLFSMLSTVTLQASSSSEDIPPTIELIAGEDSYSNRLLHSVKSKFSKQIKSVCNIDDDGIYDLRIAAEQVSKKEIEGIDTRVFLEIKFGVVLSNPFSNEILLDTMLLIKGKGESTNLAEQSAIEKLVMVLLEKLDIIRLISDNMEQFYVVNCSNSLRDLDAAGDHRYLSKASNAMLYFRDTPCAELAVAVGDSITELLAEELCRNTLQTLSVKVYSGKFLAEPIIRDLLRISPNSSCAGDALELAKEIGKQQYRRVKKTDRDRINTYVQIHLEQNKSKQLNLYRRLNWGY